MKTVWSFRDISRHLIGSTVLCFALLLHCRAAAWQDPGNPCEADTTRRLAQGSGIFTYHQSKSGTSTTLSYDGKIGFTEDERDIKSITPGGYFRYSKTTFGNKREIFIQSGSDGTLHRKYYVGKSEETYEPEGRLWLQQMLPEIIATTGLGAEDRIRRIYAKAGLNGVLAEIARIENDFAKATYYNHLLALPALKTQELKGVLAHLNRQLDSDHEKSKLLRQTAPRYLQHPEIAHEYLAVVAGLTSDYEKAKVLTYICQVPALNPSSCEIVIPAVAGIDSDYEQAKVLRTVLARQELSPKAHQQAIALTRTISSDYEKNRVLLTLMANPRYVSAHFEELLASINTLQSDHEKSRAFSYLVMKHKLSPRHYLQLLPVVSSLGSSYDKSRTLQQIRQTMPAGNAQLKAAYLKTAKTIQSDYEYRKAIAGLE